MKLGCSRVACQINMSLSLSLPATLAPQPYSAGFFSRARDISPSRSLARVCVCVCARPSSRLPSFLPLLARRSLQWMNRRSVWSGTKSRLFARLCAQQQQQLASFPRQSKPTPFRLTLPLTLPSLRISCSCQAPHAGFLGCCCCCCSNGCLNYMRWANLRILGACARPKFIKSLAPRDKRRMLDIWPGWGESLINIFFPATEKEGARLGKESKGDELDTQKGSKSVRTGPSDFAATVTTCGAVNVTSSAALFVTRRL